MIYPTLQLPEKSFTQPISLWPQPNPHIVVVYHPRTHHFFFPRQFFLLLTLFFNFRLDKY